MLGVIQGLVAGTFRGLGELNRVDEGLLRTIVTARRNQIQHRKRWRSGVVS